MSPRRNNRPLPAELMGTLSTSEDEETEGRSESLTVLIARELEDEISKNRNKNNAAREKRNLQGKKRSQAPSRRPKDQETSPKRSPHKEPKTLESSPEGSPQRSPTKVRKGQQLSKRTQDERLPLVPQESKSSGSPAKVKFNKYNITTKLPRKGDEEIIDVEDISLEKEDGLGRRRFLRAIDTVIEANRKAQHEVARSPHSSRSRHCNRGLFSAVGGHLEVGHSKCFYHR